MAIGEPEWDTEISDQLASLEERIAELERIVNINIDSLGISLQLHLRHEQMIRSLYSESSKEKS